MFKINADPQDKFQPVVFKDWAKGELLDVDTVDAPPDSLLLSENLRYLPGWLTNYYDDETETIVSSFYYIEASLYNRSTIDEDGNENDMDFYYLQEYQASSQNNILRIRDDSGWQSETMGAFTNYFYPVVFQSYGNIIDAGGTLDENGMNIQYINRARFNSDHTLDDWYATQNDTVKPTVNSSTVDSGADLDGAISDSDTAISYSGSHSLVVGDYIYVEDECMRITNDATSIFTVVRAEKATTAAAHADTTDIYADVEADYRLDDTTLAVFSSTQTLLEGVYTEGDELQYAFSLIRDGNQESALTKSSITCTVDSGNHAPIFYLKVKDGTPFDERVTAIRVYHRLNGGEWYFMGDIDIEDGITLTTESGSDLTYTWSDTYNCHTIYLLDFGINEQFTYTYHQKSGYPLDNESTNIRYKVAHTYGNRRIVADVYKNGTHYPGRLYISVPDAVNTFPDNNYLDLLEDNEQEFTALAVWERMLLAFKEDEMYVIDIRSPNEATWKVMYRRKFGVNEQRNVTIGTDAVYFATDHGIIKFNGEFQDITVNKIATVPTVTWGNAKLAYDYKHEELVVNYGNSSTYVYDKWGRWSEDDWYNYGSADPMYNSSNQLCYVFDGSSNIQLRTRQTASTYKPFDFRMHQFRPGDDNDYVMRKFRLRIYNPDPDSLTVLYSIDGGTFTSWLTGTGTARGADDEYVLEWTGKLRFKTIAFRVHNGAQTAQVGIKELIAWITPRKGRKNA